MGAAFLRTNERVKPLFAPEKWAKRDSYRQVCLQIDAAAKGGV